MNVTKDQFIRGARDAVLAALDGYMRELTGSDSALGAKDSDLPQLFDGLNTHLNRVAKRFIDPESEEDGSAFLTITD